MSLVHLPLIENKPFLMKQFYLLIASMAISSISLGQTTEFLEVNAIRTTMNQHGALFSSGTATSYFGPKANPNQSVMYMGGFWVSAYKSLDTFIAIQMYHLQGDTLDYDFRFGPVAANYDNAFTIKYDRIWKISAEEVQMHIQDFQKPGYLTPEAILNWPAHGDVANGEAQNLAPFFDQNQNGIYEPQLGDYPLIRGDQCLYAIFSDDVARVSRLNKTEPILIEGHMMMYAFNEIGNAAINNTVFLNLELFNRSSVVYDSVQLGLWTDVDLGNSDDDIAGSNSNLKLSYFYNGDADDETTVGFGTNPPAVGLYFLGQRMRSSTTYYIGGVNVPSGTHGPSESEDYLNLLSGHWRNGRPVYLETPSGLFSNQNGDGYSIGSSLPEIKWAYDESHNWYAAPKFKNDLRNVSGYPSHGALSPGQKLCLDAAIIYNMDSAATSTYDPVQNIINDLPSIENFFQNQSYNCPSSVIGLSEQALDEAPVLFPVPGQDYLRCAASEKAYPIKWRAITIDGRKVASGIFRNLNDQIELADWKPGLYLFELYKLDGEPRLIKVIIQ